MAYLIQKGTTDVSVELYLVDSSNGTPETGVVFDTSGIDLYYRRDGAAVVAITEADLATPALTDAHLDGGFLHIQDGFYRLDLPDAACASGVDKVVIGGTVTGMVVMPAVIQLVDYDPFDSIRLGLTALPNAAADAIGGLPISDAGGLDMDAILTRIPAALISGRMDSNVQAKSLTLGMSTQEKLHIKAEADNALSDYDAPTRAEATSDKDEIVTDLDDIKGTGFVKDTHSLIDIETFVDLIDDGTSGLAKIASDIAAIPTTAMRGTDNAALASEVTSTRMSELDDSAGKLVAIADLIKAAVDAVKLETDKLTLGDAGAGSTGSIIEEIENRPTTAMRGTDNVVASGPTKAEMDTAHALLATPAQVNEEVDNALNTVIPGSPIANSVNERIAAIDDLSQASGGGDLAAIKAITDLLTLAAINAEMDTAWTTQMADSVPADGTIPTREQMIYMVGQFLMDFVFSGTTRTTRKVDGSTALMTHEMDDDTTPVSLTRDT